MKIKSVITVAVSLAFIQFSCKKLTEVNPVPVDNANTGVVNPNKEVNSWIYSQMKSYYLWEDQMVAEAKTDNKLKADEYFESLLVKPGDLDRFSWIQDSAEELKASLNGISKVYGIRSAPVFANEAKTKVALSVAYALKGSPAEKAGLKRGDLISQVDGVDLTPENYGGALAKDMVTVTLGEYKNGLISNSATKLAMSRAEVQTNPIQHSEIIKVGTKKIGYIVYLQFLNAFDNDMRNVFKNFKAEGVSELVLDLRYNGGGYISASNTLSALMVKNLKPGTLMSKQEWNASQTKAYKEKYGANVFDTNWQNEANNLGSLNRVYIITSKGSASASELVINNLKPFMDVILVGDNTYGKNVGSITVEDNLKRWKWGMQPIVLKTVNAKGESEYGTKEGFSPNVRVKDDLIPYKPFGNINETLLNAAINHMTGGTVARAARVGVKQVETLTNFYPMENKSLELRDMFVEKLPFK